ncbi:MAG: arsenite methyltransferase, partial [Planctomycetota bacterium]
MKDTDAIRREVSDDYASVVQRPRSGAGCCAAAPQPKGIAVRDADYDRTALEGLPGDAVINSFGCGNPLAWADVREGDVVLDLGSGAGIDILLAADRVGPSGRVIGIDMTREMIEHANANIETAGVTNVEVREGLIEELPVPDASIDWVISNCVINLSPEKGRVFAEIFRVLKPGGRVSIADIVLDDVPEELREQLGRRCGCVSGAISEREYVAGLRGAGLEDVQATEAISYEASQVAAILGAVEEPGTESAGECCCAAGAEPTTTEMVEQITGRVR